MSLLNVNKVDPATGTALELGSSGDTLTVPSGATLSIAGTINASSGTATGFSSTFGSTYFCANRTSDETFTNATYGKLGMNNEIADPGSNYDTSNYRYTIPTTGKYFFYLMGNFDSGSNGELLSVLFSIRKNNSSHELESNINLNDNAGRNAGMTLNGVLSLSAGDYVEAWANPNDTSGNPTFKANSVFGAAGSANQWGGWRVA
mgnify:CR=1 FL=1|jgi:hypothetical protein